MNAIYKTGTLIETFLKDNTVSIGQTDLTQWVIEALKAQGGSATIVDIAKHIWANHEQELRAAGDLFYTWQYKFRWSATELRASGAMLPENESRRGLWQLAPKYVSAP